LGVAPRPKGERQWRLWGRKRTIVEKTHLWVHALAEIDRQNCLDFDMRQSRAIQSTRPALSVRAQPANFAHFGTGTSKELPFPWLVIGHT
jgi:hypothetical protein